MTTSPLQVERRVGQRFAFLLPVSIRHLATGTESVGFTQDLSSKGVFFLTDASLTEGSEIELTVSMPSEITLGEAMPVRCRGRILRVVRPNGSSEPARESSTPAPAKIGVAVRFEGYEYLSPSLGSSALLKRVSTSQSHEEDEQPLAHSSARF